LQECKGLLGKLGKVQEKVFCGGRSIVNLTNRLAYQNGTMHHFVRQVIDGGRMVHIGANCEDMFRKPILLEKLWWCVGSLGLQQR
jgi:hypothetical protein